MTTDEILAVVRAETEKARVAAEQQRVADLINAAYDSMRRLRKAQRRVDNQGDFMRSDYNENRLDLARENAIRDFAAAVRAVLS